jgi:hypothetical protein
MARQVKESQADSQGDDALERAAVKFFKMKAAVTELEATLDRDRTRVASADAERRRLLVLEGRLQQHLALRSTVTLVASQSEVPILLSSIGRTIASARALSWAILLAQAIVIGTLVTLMFSSAPM